MATISINDLATNIELDDAALAACRGGRAALFWMPTYEALKARKQQARRPSILPTQAQPVTYVQQDILNVYNVTNNIFDIDIAALNSGLALDLGPASQPR